MATKAETEAMENMVAAQIELAIAAPEAWRTSNRDMLLMLPNGAEIVERTLKGIRDRKRKVQIAKAMQTVVAEDARPEDFDAKLEIVVDAMITISDNIEIFKWETVGQRGAGNKSYKQRVAKIPVMNGEIAIQHKQERKS